MLCKLDFTNTYVSVRTKPNLALWFNSWESSWKNWLKIYVHINSCQRDQLTEKKNLNNAARSDGHDCLDSDQSFAVISVIYIWMKKRRESSKRNYYIISPRVIIKAIIIIMSHLTLTLNSFCPVISSTIEWSIQILIQTTNALEKKTKRRDQPLEKHQM